MRPVLARFSEPVYALVRIVVGFLFACHGSQKLFGVPPGGPPHPLPPLILAAGIIELAGGVLVAIGLLASAAAFICSGEMAFAYFMVHAKAGFLPIVNKGEPAVLYCFVFLLIAARGSGAWSLDHLRTRRP